MSGRSIIIRAQLTDAEWLALRKLALDRGVPVSRLTGDHLRKLLGKGKA